MQHWWGINVAADLAVPGYAKNNKYDVIILTFWLSYGAADSAAMFANPLSYFGNETPLGKTNE